MPHDAAVTVLLHRVRGGDQGALEQLIPIVYNELRRIAESYLRQERPGHTLQATALVHEAYLRMVNQDQPEFENRAHFYGIAAQVMRQVLVDHARARLAGKRGGGVQKISWDDSLDFTSEKASLIVAPRRRHARPGRVRPAESPADRTAVFRRADGGKRRPR